MAGAKKGDTVKIHYTAKLEDGTQFDSSEGKDPMEFTIGEGTIIPELENQVSGMEKGEKKTFTMTADQAYGQRDERLVVELAKDKLPEGLDIQVGSFLQISHPQGGQGLAQVLEIKDASVVIDANHPLAGKDLTFDIEVVGIADQKSE